MIDRATANDVLQLHYSGRAADTQVGALLVLAPDEPLAADEPLAVDEPLAADEPLAVDDPRAAALPLAAATIRDALADRVRTVPRLRQRLHPVPFGCGRPIWVDDPSFDLARHLHVIRCPDPADEPALLDVVADAVAAPLPSDRPPWAITVVEGLPDARTGLVLVFHHVLADGIGGLAVLAHLVDGADASPVSGFPRPRPTRRRLAADAWRGRLRAVRHLPAVLRELGEALVQLRGVAGARAPACSLNRPIGPKRALAVVRTDLDAVRARAHRSGVTVNDVVLTAVTGAVHDHLAARGEQIDELVVSIPVSGHGPTGSGEVHNQAGVVPVRLPASGDAVGRMERTGQATRVVRSGSRGATAAVLEPLFALLTRLRLVTWFTTRQRRVNTFVTNLRGPDRELRLCGARIVDVVPMGVISGNVGVAFGVLSYAGALDVTVVADPEVCHDLGGLAARLQEQLAALTGR